MLKAYCTRSVQNFITYYEHVYRFRISRVPNSGVLLTFLFHNSHVQCNVDVSMFGVYVCLFECLDSDNSVKVLHFRHIRFGENSSRYSPKMGFYCPLPFIIDFSKLAKHMSCGLKNIFERSHPHRT